MYAPSVGSKHESKSLFQNLVRDIVEVQTLGDIILLGGDFNAHIITLPDTIDTNDLCELLQALELVETKQLDIVAKQQNRDASVSGWGRKLLDLCRDARLFIPNGRTLGDELREFICLANGGRNIVDYIVGSPTIWQVVTQLKMIIDETRYYTMGGDSDHRLLPLRLSIDCTFVELQHIVVTKKILSYVQIG